jgi:peptidoglycan/xylan/chitin deacetylase (PgdA/CDA1 family)
MKNLLIRAADINLLHKINLKLQVNHHHDVFFHVLKQSNKDYSYFFSDFDYNSSLFLQQLTWLKKMGFQPVSLSEYYNDPSAYKNKKTFSVSTDDGYSENYFEHLPILKKEKIPCTFYLCNNVIDNKSFLWADRLFYIQNKKITVSNLDVIREKYQLPDLGQYRDLIHWSGSWPMHKANEISREIWNNSSCAPEEELLSQLQPYLTSGQVREIIDAGFEIGAHTLSHYDMSRLDYDHAYEEIVGSFNGLSQMFGQKIQYFAYPYGRRAKPEYEEKIIEATGAALFLGTKNNGTNSLSSKFFQRDDIETSLSMSRFYFSTLPVARKYFNPVIKLINKWKQ